MSTKQKIWIAYKTYDDDNDITGWDAAKMRDFGTANTLSDLLDYITTHEEYTITERNDANRGQIVLLAKDDDEDIAKLVLIEHSVWNPNQQLDTAPSRPTTITAAEWHTVAEDVKAGRCEVRSPSHPYAAINHIEPIKPNSAGWDVRISDTKSTYRTWSSTKLTVRRLDTAPASAVDAGAGVTKLSEDAQHLDFYLLCEKEIVKIRSLVLKPNDSISDDYLGDAVSSPTGITMAVEARMQQLADAQARVRAARIAFERLKDIGNEWAVGDQDDETTIRLMRDVELRASIALQATPQPSPTSELVAAVLDACKPLIEAVKDRSRNPQYADYDMVQSGYKDHFGIGTLTLRQLWTIADAAAALKAAGEA